MSSVDARLRLHHRHQRLAEFVVGDAEHRAIMHAGNRMQRGFDFGGIDVDAARDHHVALAVADEDIAVLVDIADIARGDESVAFDLGALLRLVVIGEIRIACYARIDFADLALRQNSSIVADKTQLGARRNLADRARLLQRVLRIGEGDRAGFGRAVEFIDHRPPPFDHRALDVGGTGGGGMNDMMQRGHVVFPAHLFRQFHQPNEHRRHHEDGVDLLVLDRAAETPPDRSAASTPARRRDGPPAGQTNSARNDTAAPAAARGRRASSRRSSRASAPATAFCSGVGALRRTPLG